MQSTEIMVVAIVSVLVSFGLPVLLVGIVLYYKLRRERMIHATIASLAEKGLPVPPGLLARSPQATGNRDLRSGLILIGLGIGLTIFFAGVAPAVWAIGLIPGLIGVAFLITWHFDRRPATEPNANDR
jgi:hypothetical protein